MEFLDLSGVSYLWGAIKNHVSTAISSQKFKTINNNSILGSGNINIDLTLYKVVTALPTENIDVTKIYLVKDSDLTGNIYAEYMYVDSQWEKIGDFRSTVDLAPYAKVADVNAALDKKVDKVSGKGLSTNDYTTTEKNKLAGIAEGANKYTLPQATSSALGGVKIGYATSSANRNYAVALSNGQMYVNVPWTDNNTTYGEATTSAAGLMSANDKAKLDGIVAITETQLKGILV